MPRRFDFISPGVQLREVDQSQIAPTPEDDGLLLIGRAPKGPAMKPVLVRSFADFREIFGDPVPGKQSTKADIWREGNYSTPMYAMYAAQAYLASGVAPVKFVRLVGQEDADKSTGGEAGWTLATDGPKAEVGLNDGAFGLFIAPSGTISSGNPVGTLAAVFYTNNAGIGLAGQKHDLKAPTGIVTGSAQFVKSVGANSTFKVIISGSTPVNAGVTQEFVVGFDPSDSTTYIRDQLNTNPLLIRGNENFGRSNSEYLL